jgi:hypothetical protein
MVVVFGCWAPAFGARAADTVKAPIPCEGIFDTFTYGTNPTMTEIHVPLQCGTRRLDFYGTGVAQPAINPCSPSTVTTAVFTGRQTEHGYPETTAEWTVHQEGGVSTLTGFDARGTRWRAAGTLAAIPGEINCTPSWGTRVRGVRLGEPSLPPTLLRCTVDGTQAPAFGSPGREINGPVQGSGSCTSGKAKWGLTYEGSWDYAGNVGGNCDGRFWLYVHLLDQSTGQSFEQDQTWTESVVGAHRLLDMTVNFPGEEVATVHVGVGDMKLSGGPCDVETTRSAHTTLTFLFLP